MNQVMNQPMYVQADVSPQTQQALAQSSNEIIRTTLVTVGSIQALEQIYGQAQWVVTRGLINSAMIAAVAQQQGVWPGHLANLDAITGDFIHNVRQTLQKGADNIRENVAAQPEPRRGW